MKVLVNGAGGYMGGIVWRLVKEGNQGSVLAAAVENFTKSFAAYFAAAGVRVNAIAPGFIVNERSKAILGTVEEGLTQRGQDVIKHTPMGNFGQAGDMCGTIRYLLDDRLSSFVTGVTIPVDGGFLTLSGV